MLLAVGWTGSANDNLFSSAGNWTGQQVPGQADDVRVNKNALIKLDIHDAGQFHKTVLDFGVMEDSTTLNLNNHALNVTNRLWVSDALVGNDSKLTVADGNGPTGKAFAKLTEVGKFDSGGQLVIDSGSLTTQSLVAHSPNGEFGDPGGTSMVVKSLLEIRDMYGGQQQFVVGKGSGSVGEECQLTIDTVGHAKSDAELIVGTNLGKGKIITAASPNSRLSVDKPIVLGQDGGRGEMDVKSGAAVKTFGARLGENYNGDERPWGTVTVEQGATWSIASPALTPSYAGAELKLGIGGTGQITIAGTVETGDTTVGVSSGGIAPGVGKLILVDEGQINVHGEMLVGDDTLGVGMASGDAKIVSKNAIIANHNNAIVDLWDNAHWDADGEFAVTNANDGLGKVHLRDSSRIDSKGGEVGFLARGLSQSSRVQYGTHHNMAEVM